MANLSAKMIELLNKFSDTQIALRDSDKPYGESGMALGDAIEKGYSNLGQIKDALYDFDVHAGAIGEILLGEFVPAGAIITRAWTQMKTTFDSGGLATVAIKVNGSEIKAATAFDDASYTGIKEIPLSDPILISSEGEVKLDVAAAELTAGKMRIMIEYITE